MYAFGRFVGIRRVGQRIVHFDGAYMPFAALRSFAFLLVREMPGAFFHYDFKDAALVDPARYKHPCPVRVGNMFRQRQSDARSGRYGFVGFQPGIDCLIETVEDMGDIGFANTLSAVMHGDMYLVGMFVHGHPDLPACRSIFKGIGEEVVEYFLHLCRVEP